MNRNHAFSSWLLFPIFTEPQLTKMYIIAFSITRTNCTKSHVIHAGFADLEKLSAKLCDTNATLFLELFMDTFLLNIFKIENEQSKAAFTISENFF